MHPILKKIEDKIILLNNNVGKDYFLNYYDIPLNKDYYKYPAYINWDLITKKYSSDITHLGNQDVIELLNSSDIANQDYMIIWYCETIIKVPVKVFIEYWEEFFFASSEIFVFITLPQNICGEFFRYQGIEKIYWGWL